MTAPRASLTRGGRKLAAALERWPDLRTSLRGARAVDLGASTGGFVRVLLGAGVAHVTAVDVGHDQLDADLRADPRVENHERTDWKRLALDKLPGPFDAFTVDVSFVAARNMLRGLAFRLRPRAVGVVLVKPQFELPSRLVKGGDVSDEGLRARALATFREKAETLGFEIVDVVDSPVEGGSGTVELLARLSFRGRTAALPQPGERRGSSVRARPEPEAARRWFAVVAPGLEEVARAELASIEGASDVAVIPGGVSFAGDLTVGLRANLRARVATRILLRLAEAEARDFAPLRRRLARVPWEHFLQPGAPLATSITTHRCRLYHTGALAETLELAISDRLGTKPLLVKVSDETVVAARVFMRGDGDVFTVSLDSSGALLHMRGERVQVGPAPLRETLAAGILALARWTPAEPLYDPMCGAGTFVLEAAGRALGRAAGAGRAFAMESWPCMDPALATEARSEAAQAASPAAPITGGDRAPDVLAAAQRNAADAGLAGAITWLPGSFESVTPGSAPGLLVTNPPYGRRLGSPREAQAVYAALGRALRGRLAAWRAAIVVPDPACARALGGKPASTHTLAHGGLRVRLLVFSAAAR